MQGLNAELCPSTFEENLDVADFKEFSDYIEATALGKAEEVFQRLSGVDDSKKLLVIAADTMVTLGKEIYGKPKDAADAVRMLTKYGLTCAPIKIHLCPHFAAFLAPAIASLRASSSSMRKACANLRKPPTFILAN